MKLKKSGIIALSLITTLGLGLAHIVSANTGVDNGGGGDAVRLQDDRVVLADPFIQRAGMGGELHPELVAEINRAGKLFTAYGANKAFVEQEVLNPLIEYRFVDQIPALATCRNRVALGSIPAGASVEQVACTQGEITWIRQDIFRQMSVREQAMTIIHERLRGMNESISDESLGNVTDGLRFALELYNAQFLGERPVLDAVQFEILYRLRRTIFQTSLCGVEKGLRLVEFKKFEILKNGGGLAKISDVKIFPRAYVGAGVVVNAHPNGMSFVLDGSVLIATNVCETICAIYNNAVVINSNFNKVFNSNEYYALPSIGENSKILNSVFTLDRIGVKIGANTTITDSILPSVYRIGGQTSITASTLIGVASIGSSVSIEQTQIKYNNVFFEDETSVSNLKNTIFHSSNVNHVFFKKGFTLDAAGKAVCSSGKNDFDLTLSAFKAAFGSSVSIRDGGELIKYCTK